MRIKQKVFQSFLFLVFSLPVSLLGQSLFTVKGKLITLAGNQPSGNIVALNPVDSTILKGDFFLNGSFALSNIEQPRILLQFSSLEFQDTILNVHFSEVAILDLGEIMVKEAGVALDEVVVKSKRSIYRQRTDGVVEIRIENTSLAASNSTMEILSKSPEIIMGEAGEISVLGKGEAIIFLNGRRISEQQLAMIPPTNISTIEIIRNPSAKYDAEGAAVIQIITKSSGNDGYQVGIQQNLNHSRFGGNSSLTALNFNYAQNRFATQFNYSLQTGNERMLLYTTRDRTPANGFLQTDLTTDWKYDFDNYVYYGGGLQYNYAAKSYLSLEYAGYQEQQSGSVESNNTITDLTGENFYDSLIEVDELGGSNSLSLNWNHALDTLGTQLFVGAQYANFSNLGNNFITENSLTANEINSTRTLKNLSDLNINLLSGQADFTKVFSNKNTLETGLRYSETTIDSDIDFLIGDVDGEYEQSAELSNNFNYQENISAAYANFKGKLTPQWFYQLGLRAELTDYDLRLGQLDNESISDRYLNLFPNLSLNWQPVETYTFNFAYTARIRRAAYQALNPTLIYQDPYTSIQGNPNLQPARTHAFEISNKYQQTTLKLGYNHIINPFG
ncbi:MAG: TonB-dependent receptor, partial [Saprospiraceae bacterium]